MQTFLLPKVIWDKIDKINKDFFWNKIHTQNYHPLISWDRICSDLDFGGLGLKKAEDMNKALHMKLIWKLKTKPDNIWVKLIKKKYLKGEDILKLDQKTNMSWQFARMLNIRDSFEKGLRWEFGNGENINFWNDLWLGNSSLLNFINNTDQDLKISDFIKPNREWDRLFKTSQLLT